MKKHEFSDAALEEAIRSSRTWEQVFPALGFNGRPGGSTQDRIRRRVKGLGLTTDHFVRRYGPVRRWTDEKLVEAVAESDTWSGVVARIGGRHSTCRNRALELGLDVSALDARSHTLEPSADAPIGVVTPKRLRHAADMIAAAWYTMHGYQTFFPTYDDGVDLMAINEDGRVIRVQVKSSVNTLVHTEKPSTRLGYSAADIEEMFLVRLDGSLYRIPIEAIDGQSTVSTGSKYAKYLVSMF